MSGLSQLAVMQDLAAKVVCDNLHALVAAAAHAHADLAGGRRINRAYAQTAMRPSLPSLLMGEFIPDGWHELLDLIARRTHVHRAGRSKPRPPRNKPLKYMTQKAS